MGQHRLFGDDLGIDVNGRGGNHFFDFIRRLAIDGEVGCRIDADFAGAGLAGGGHLRGHVASLGGDLAHNGAFFLDAGIAAG